MEIFLNFINLNRNYVALYAPLSKILYKTATFNVFMLLCYILENMFCF